MPHVDPSSAPGRRRVAVVIPVHNRRDVTLAGLRSLAAADTTGLDVRIVVVDDGSTDGTGAAIAAELPDVDLLAADGTAHYAGGTNLGIERALAWDAELVITANDDAEFDRNVIRALVACADRHPGAVIGALLLRHEDRSRAFQVGLRFDPWYGGWRVPQHWRLEELPDREFEVETVVGNCLLVPAELVRTVGLLDARRFPIGAADVQWVRRMQRLGRRCFVATDARVYCRANEVLPPLRSLGIRRALRVATVDRTHPLNLRRQWRALRYSAPSRATGIVAFAVYVTRFAARALRPGRWPDWPDPPVPSP